MVKYDTVISVPASKDLKPGMSAEIEVVLSEYKKRVAGSGFGGG